MVTFRTLEHIQQLLAETSGPDASLKDTPQMAFQSEGLEPTLYMDGGSSFLKLGRWSGKASEYVVQTVSWEEGEEALSGIFQQFLSEGTKYIVASLVNAPSKERLNELFRILGEQYDFEVVWLDHAFIEGLDLSINYSPVNSLGLDRLLAAYGAHAVCPGPVVVVDLGSAVTVDSLTQTQFDGGVIAPGLKAVQVGMQQITPHLPIPSAQKTSEFPPKSTKNALWWGQYAFWVAGIEGMILEVARAANTQDVILTGGDAIWFSDQVVNQRREDWPLQDAAGGLNVGTQKDHSMEGMRVMVRPHLVLEGLRHLSRRSCF
jgi:pantothenate kinase type III